MYGKVYERNTDCRFPSRTRKSRIEAPPSASIMRPLLLSKVGIQLNSPLPPWLERLDSDQAQAERKPALRFRGTLGLASHANLRCSGRYSALTHSSTRDRQPLMRSSPSRSCVRVPKSSH